MHNAIIKSFAVVLAIGISCAYFTSPTADASMDSKLYDELKGRYLAQENVILKLYFRLDRAEQKLKMEVPPELKIEVNKLSEY